MASSQTQIMNVDNNNTLTITSIQQLPEENIDVSTIQNHTGSPLQITHVQVDASKPQPSSGSLKKVKNIVLLYFCLLINFHFQFFISKQYLVDYEGDSDEEDDEDQENSHLSKKARIA